MSHDEFNFCLDKEGVPVWHKTRLVTYSDAAAQFNQFSSVFKALDFDFYTTTHVRSSGISSATLSGLNKEDISYQSKHVKDKLDSAYMPELCYIVSFFYYLYCHILCILLH